MALVFLVEEDQNGVEGQAFDSPASFDRAIFWMLCQLQHFQLRLRIVTQTHQSPKPQSQLVRYTTPLEIEEPLYQSAVLFQKYPYFGNKPKPAIQRYFGLILEHEGHYCPCVINKQSHQSFVFLKTFLDQILKHFACKIYLFFAFENIFLGKTVFWRACKKMLCKQNIFQHKRKRFENKSWDIKRSWCNKHY